MFNRPRPARALVTAAVAGALAAACSTPGQPDTPIDRDRFVETYVELRRAALAHDGEAMISDTARARVLTEQGVTEDDLLAFAETHGTDVELMNEIWDEVEVRLDALRQEAEPR